MPPGHGNCCVEPACGAERVGHSSVRSLVTAKDMAAQPLLRSCHAGRAELPSDAPGQPRCIRKVTMGPCRVRKVPAEFSRIPPQEKNFNMIPKITFVGRKYDNGCLRSRPSEMHSREEFEYESYCTFHVKCYHASDACSTNTNVELHACNNLHISLLAGRGGVGEANLDTHTI